MSLGQERTPAIDADRWVDEHGDALYRFALLKVRDPDVAADLVQEAFLAAWKGRGEFAGRSTERTWLIGVLRHKALDRLRASSRERAREAPGPEGPSEFFDDRGHWRRAPRHWGAQGLERIELAEALQECLESAPPTLAEAFVLREVDGLSAEETCATLGISPQNLWARTHRARLKLRACLEQKGLGP